MRARLAAAVAMLVAGIAFAFPATARADGPADERKFLTATEGLPMYVLPRGHDSTRADILAGGYRVCALLDQDPTNTMQEAERFYYRGGNTLDGQITYDGELFFIYSTLFLCKRHSHLYENY
jgi:serine/threonine-protein kinase